MLEYIGAKDSIGKIIKNYLNEPYYNKVMIIFTDNTYLALYSRQYYNNVDIKECSIDIGDFKDEDLIRVGFITQEEINKIREDKEYEKFKRNEEYEKNS